MKNGLLDVSLTNGHYLSQSPRTCHLGKSTAQLLNFIGSSDWDVLHNDNVIEVVVDFGWLCQEDV